MYISCLYIGDICIRSYVAFPRCFCQNREANVSALKQLSPAGCCYVRMGFLKKKMVHQKSRSTLTSIYVVYLNSLELLLCLHCLLLLYWWFFLKSFWQFVDAAPMCYVDQEIYVFSPCAPVCLFGMLLIVRHDAVSNTFETTCTTWHLDKMKMLWTWV